jgi:hypothetical protein
MGRGARVVGLILLGISLPPLGVVGFQQTSGDQPSAHSGGRASDGGPKQPDQPAPPYHKSAKEAKPFPALVPASHFANRPVVARAYQIASQIPGVLAQQPCYCHCDQHFGHKSLLDCFASDHTAGCAICVKETFFAYQLTQQGKKPSEIRQAILRGDFQKVDINQPPR